MRWSEDQLYGTKMSTVRAAMRRWMITQRNEQQQANSHVLQGGHSRRR
jgi:hypothetical protein